MDRGSGCSRPVSCSMWHKPSWRKLPLDPSQRHWADNPWTAEQLYQRNSHTIKKVPGLTIDFPTWGSGKGTENLQGIRHWRPVGFDYKTSAELGNKTMCAPEARRRSSAPTSDWVRIPCESPGLSGGSVSQHFGLRPNNREGTQPPPSTENWIQYCWAWPRPSEQDPVSPTVIVSHQEASITLLSLFIRGQTEWKPWSQKTNQTDHMDFNLV